MTATRTPLEDFVRDYVETTGGVWDEVEPQVYDLLLPARQEPGLWQGESLRVTFDPEALPEHPGSQLASYGTPLVERLLDDAMERGRFSRLYYLGLNLSPHDLAGRVRKALTLAPGVQFNPERVRTLHFAQALFWFQATFISDQKEQEVLVASLDLHYGRQVRHREKLLDQARLADQPAQPFPEARRLSLAAAYPLARAEVLRALAPLANARDRELRERLQRQTARMRRYYADLRRELETVRGKDSEQAQARRAGRLQAIDNEERLRVSELYQKNSLRVNLRLLNTLAIQQPKLLVAGKLLASKRPEASLELVWDPLVEAAEAVPCPTCKRPTFALEVARSGRVCCTACGGEKA
jgi:hypothetical protein